MTGSQDADAVEAAVEAARGEVRRRVWDLAGEHAPTAGISAACPLVIDVDATLVEAHWAKEGAAPTFKGGFGYHPLTAWFDHGPHGAGQCAAIMLRPGNAGANTAADHIEVISRALDQAGLGSRPGRKVLVRTGRGRGNEGDRGVPRPPPGLLQRGLQAPRPHAADLPHHPRRGVVTRVQRRRRPQPGGGRGRDPPTCWT